MKDRHHRNFNFNYAQIIHPIIFYDNCEGNVLWSASGTGADYTCDLFATLPFIGTKSLRLLTKSTTPAATDYVTANKYVWATPLKRLNFQFVFMRYGSASSYIYTLLYWYDGTNCHSAGLRFLNNEATVFYLNSGATYTALDSATWTFSPSYTWNHVSITLDLTNHTYIQATINNQFHSLATIAYPTSASANSPVLQIYLTVETRTTAIAGAEFDQILLRGDNP